MALFFITYDLRAKRNYQALYDELNSFEAVCVLESTWCFNRIDISASELCDHFSALLDYNDGIVISEVTDWASSNADRTPNDL